MQRWVEQPCRKHMFRYDVVSRKMQRRDPRRKAFGDAGASAILKQALGVGALVAALAAAAQPVSGQTLDQIFRVMQEGGTWLSLDIVDGQGSYIGARMPTMGFKFEGWFQVADVNRGDWDIRVVDLVESGAPVVDVTTRAGERIPVSYDAGATVQVQVDVTWSEPADTVLWVWVGLPERASPGGVQDGGR